VRPDNAAAGGCPAVIHREVGGRIDDACGPCAVIDLKLDDHVLRLADRERDDLAGRAGRKDGRRHTGASAAAKAAAGRSGLRVGSLVFSREPACHETGSPDRDGRLSG